MFKLSMTLEDVMFDSLRFEIWKRINGTNDSFSVKVEWKSIPILRSKIYMYYKMEIWCFSLYFNAYPLEYFLEYFSNPKWK